MESLKIDQTLSMGYLSLQSIYYTKQKGLTNKTNALHQVFINIWLIFIQWPFQLNIRNIICNSCDNDIPVHYWPSVEDNARGRYSNIFRTLTFILSQDESQGSITWIVDGQSLSEQGQPCILVKPQSEIIVLATCIEMVL